MQPFHGVTGHQQLGNFFPNNLPSIFSKPAQRLFHRFSIFQTFKECSANSLSTPTKSSVDQAKMF
jgi:hypothetical protein